MNSLKNLQIYDRKLEIWGVIKEVELPFVQLSFPEGRISLFSKIPLRAIGKGGDRFWFSNIQSENDRVRKEVE